MRRLPDPEEPEVAPSDNNGLGMRKVGGGGGEGGGGGGGAGSTGTDSPRIGRQLQLLTQSISSVFETALCLPPGPTLPDHWSLMS